MLINKVNNKLGLEPLGYVSAHPVFIKHCINILLNFLLHFRLSVTFSLLFSAFRYLFSNRFCGFLVFSPIVNYWKCHMASCIQNFLHVEGKTSAFLLGFFIDLCHAIHSACEFLRSIGS